MAESNTPIAFKGLLNGHCHAARHSKHLLTMSSPRSQGLLSAVCLLIRQIAAVGLLTPVQLLAGSSNHGSPAPKRTVQESEKGKETQELCVSGKLH